MEYIGEIAFTNLQETLEAYCAKVSEFYKRHLEESGRKASGNLIDSVSIDVTYGAYTIKCILSVADYYRWVENGRPSGKQPPREKILQWIIDKNIQPYPMANGKLPTENQLAFLIARKIGREGYRGSGDLKQTLAEINQEFIPLFKEALERDFGIYQLRILEDIDKIVKI